MLWKCVPINLTVKNLPPRNAALLRRRPADMQVICDYAAETVANVRCPMNTTRWLGERLRTPKVKQWKKRLHKLTLPATYIA
jgi:hypothetical protein